MMVRLSPDRRSFTIGEHGPGNWSGTYPVEDLPNKLRFYRSLRDRKDGKYARHYQPTVAALEALAREIGGVAEASGAATARPPPVSAYAPRSARAHTAGHGETQFSLGL